ncbi:MAG: InlB B-repeat-containing protein, partial [Clostridia bacterium]|nr:InlB B-repeat-containing protein [Clostridia bacterium]
MKKRMLSMLLAIVMVVGMLPVEVLAMELVQITLDPNGGTLNGSTEEITFRGISDQTLYAAYGGAYPIPQKAGYVFAGWYNAEHDMSLSEGDWSSFELSAIPEHFTAQWAEAAAEIDETPYATLQDALTAAQDDDTVKVLKDVELDESLTIPNSITLDLNGKTINGSMCSISAEQSLTVVDTSEAGGGELAVSYSDPSFVLGDLTIRSGKVSFSGMLGI